MPARSAFEYVVIRVVPRVERGECLNAGVILICRPERFLAATIELDLNRLRAFAPYLDDGALAEIERQLAVIPRIAAGNSDAGPIAGLGLGERWHWLSAPSSTVIQPGPVHTGLCVDPEAELDQLVTALVRINPEGAHAAQDPIAAS